MFLDKITKYSIILLLLLLLLSGSRVLSQGLSSPDTAIEVVQDCGLTLSGKVLDHDSNTSLIGATVRIPALNRATVTDEYGNYHFHQLCQGIYTLEVTYIGYVREAFSYRINASSVRNLQLHEDTRQLRSVEIRGSRLSEQPLATATLSGRELEETRGLSLGESLRKLAGVSTIQTGPAISKPVIHGLHGNRILILNNGVRHEAQQWGDEHAPEIDPLIASELKVVKGAAGVRYGSDAIGGIVLVNPKSLPDSAGVKGEVGLIGATNSLLGSVSAMLEGRLKRAPLSWRLHSSLKKAGTARTPDYYLSNTGFEEQNLTAALAYQESKFGSELYYSFFHTKIGVLSSAHVGNTTDLINAINRKQPEETGAFTYDINRPYQDVSHHLLKAKGNYKTGEASELVFTYAFQQNIRDEYDKHRPRNNELAARNNPELHLDLISHISALTWEHKLAENTSGSIGATTIWQSNTYQGRYFIPFFHNFTAGAFWEERWRKDNLALEAGVRYDHKSLNISKRERDRSIIRPSYTFHNLSGSLGAMYDLGYHLTLSGNIGYASRAPHANELFADGVHHGTASYEVGNPNLISEHALNTVATISYYSNRRLNGEISVYHNTIFNYIYLQADLPAILTIRGAFPGFYYRQEDATFRGLDLSVQYNLTDKLVLDSKGSLVRAFKTGDKGYLPNIPADRVDTSLRYEVGDFSLKHLSEAYLAVGVLTVARQHRADTETEPYLLPPKGYNLLHAELGTSVQVGRQRIEVGITGSNLLNTTYRDYQNRLRYFADETGRMLLFRVKIPLDIL